jgi:hypothetical protein
MRVWVCVSLYLCVDFAQPKARDKFMRHILLKGQQALVQHLKTVIPILRLVEIIWRVIGILAFVEYIVIPQVILGSSPKRASGYASCHFRSSAGSRPAPPSNFGNPDSNDYKNTTLPIRI